MGFANGRRGCAHPKYAAALSAVVAAGVLIAPGVTAARGPLPGNNAGTGQYIEALPGATGDVPSAPGTRPSANGLPPAVQQRLPPGASGAQPSANTLPFTVQRRLPPGAEGELLRRLATDPGAGAPLASGRDGAAARRAPRLPAGDDGRSALSALARVLAGASGATVPLLALGLAVLTLAAGAARRRSRSHARVD